MEHATTATTTNAPETTTATTTTAKTEVATPPKAAAPELIEVAVDGKKMRVTIDELKKHYSLGTVAHKRFEEAAHMRKQAEKVLSKAKDPSKVIELLEDPDLGLNKDQVREAFENWYLNNFIKPEEMTPEQLELEKAKQKLTKYEQKEKEREEQERLAKEKEEDEKTLQSLQQEMVEILEQSQLPKTKFLVNRIAHWVRINEQKGLNAPRELIIDQVTKEMRDIVGSVTKDSTGEHLVKILGQDVVKKIREYDLSKIRAARQKPRVETVQPVNNSKKPEILTESDVKRRARELWS